MLGRSIKFHQKPWGARGAALVEFALVVTLLLLLGFACIEYARLFRAYEAMSSISREAARIPFVNCETGNFGTCMTTSRSFAKLTTFADAALPGCEIIVSAYDRVGPSTVSMSGRVGAPKVLGSDPERFETPRLKQQSGFDVTKIRTQIGTENSLLYVNAGGPNKTRMVIGEVFCPIRSVSPLAFLFRPTQDLLYEVTMY